VQRFIDLAAWVQPLLLFNLALLALLGERLRRCTGLAGARWCLAGGGVSAAVDRFLALHGAFDEGGWQRLLSAPLLGGDGGRFMLYYLPLRLPRPCRRR
jgi:hypothetical protein